MKVNFQLR